MHQNFPDNALYEMDNLEVLRGMNGETIDLIATDPPFNIKRNRSGTAGHYVDNRKRVFLPAICQIPKHHILFPNSCFVCAPIKHACFRNTPNNSESMLPMRRI